METKHNDLRDLPRSVLLQQVSEIIGPGSAHEMHVAGIVAVCHISQGEVQGFDEDRIAVDDADEFFAFFGAPVTHERAALIVIGKENAKGGEFAHLFDDELERATESVLDNAAELAMENYYDI